MTSRRGDLIGWDREISALPTVDALVRAGRDRSLHMGAQIYVSIGGDTVTDSAIGESRPGVALETTDLVPWTCISKPITSTLVARTWEQGLLDLEVPVADVVPEFAQHGKHVITLRHLLMHNSGLPGDPMSMVFAKPWDEVIAYVCDLRMVPRRLPGLVFTYVRESAWFMVAEVLRRTLNIDNYPEYVRREVFEPLDMKNCWFAMTPGRFRAYGNGIVPVQGMSPYGPMTYMCMQNDAQLAPRSSPGESGRGPLREYARFCESLLGVAGRRQLIAPETVREFTTPRVSDRKQRLDWGLGFKAERTYRASRNLYPQDTFGHDGLDSSLALADTRHQLAVAVAFNGQPRRTMGRGSAGLFREQLFVAALYRDLGLAIYDDTSSEKFAHLDARLDRFLREPAPI
jgi:CubicO group peptidase (beta-lactamase class C family)